MTRNALLQWSWANVLTKKRYDALLARFGDLDTAMRELDFDVLRAIGCREDTAQAVLNRLEELDTDAYDVRLQAGNLTLISLEDERYPSALKTIDDPPVFLTAKGDMSLLERPLISLVGTRNMSPYGKRVTEAFIPPIVHAGVVTVSGLAYGIDAQVARESIAAGGKTVAVLGHGLGMIYPKAHARLADDIVQGGGLLLSEFPLDVVPDTYTFPARNRIIAGLSLATVILEASEKSGSLITADLALDYNRDVFAVPGQVFDPNYAGCNQIIAKGYAQLVRTPEDVLAAVGLIIPERAGTAVPPAFDTPEEEQIYGALTSMPQSLDDMAVRVSCNVSAMSACLTMLELKGAAKNIGEGKWVRS